MTYLHVMAAVVGLLTAAAGGWDLAKGRPVWGSFWLILACVLIGLSSFIPYEDLRR